MRKKKNWEVLVSNAWSVCSVPLYLTLQRDPQYCVYIEALIAISEGKVTKLSASYAFGTRDLKLFDASRVFKWILEIRAFADHTAKARSLQINHIAMPLILTTLEPPSILVSEISNKDIY